jgi:transcription antitermination protein NusB
MPRTRRERVETRGRARALQALYAWDARRGEPLEKIAAMVWDDLGVDPGERRVASLLVRELASSGEEIDRELADVTANWRLERLGAIERCVLRLGAAELRMGQAPARVVLKESVRLAERFGTEKAARFVNGVLDSLARRMGVLEAANR